MKLLKLEAEGILGLPDGSYSFCHAGDSPSTGTGACGKTSLLKAIVAAKEIEELYQIVPKAEQLLRVGAERGSIKAWWALTVAEIAFAAAHIDDEVDDAGADPRGLESESGRKLPVVPPIITTEVQIPDQLTPLSTSGTGRCSPTTATSRVGASWSCSRTTAGSCGRSGKSRYLPSPAT